MRLRSSVVVPVMVGASPACSAGQPAPTARSATMRDVATALVQHHAQTVRLLTLPQTLRLGPEMIDLTERIRSRRLAEIDELSSLLRSWGDRLPDIGLAHEDERHRIEYDGSVPGAVDHANWERGADPEAIDLAREEVRRHAATIRALRRAQEAQAP